MKDYSKLLKSAQNLQDDVVATRRQIHRYPEIGRKEEKTSSLIRDNLTKFGVDEILSITPTSVVALIKGNLPGEKCLALRADIDALPVEEDTGLEFASEVPGMMHACGHDMHAAMLLGTAKLLCDNRDEFGGTIKLIFQHSEDTLPGGAKELTEKGVMENPHVDAILGMHIIPDEKKDGVIAFKSGPLTTSVDLFDFTVTGVGGHGSTPHLTKDPILAACQLVVLLQQIQARYTNPLESIIFPICNIHSGDAPNVIPNEAKLGGVARTYSEDLRKDMTKQVYDIAKGVENLSGCKIDINHYEGYPTCTNDEELTEFAKKSVAKAIGNDRVLTLKEPLAFSEDFSYFTNMTGTPGMYMFLYAKYLGEPVPLHNAKLSVSEGSMAYGIAAMSATALAYMNK